MTRKILLVITALLFLFINLIAQKEVPPEGGQPKDFKLPKKTTFQLENGIAVTMVQYGKVPKVTISVVIRTGVISEKSDEVWLSSIVGLMMKEGTKNRTSTKLREDIALLGGSLDVNVGDDRTIFSCDVLSDKGPNGVELLADVIQNPIFPESELSRIKNDKLRELSIAKSDPGSLTEEKFMKILYNGHPYGSGFPTENMINNLTIDHVKKFYQENFGALRSCIYIVGKFDEKDMEEAVRNEFSKFKREPAITENIASPRSKKEIYIIDRPGSAQSTIMLGLPVIDPANEDYIPLQVANTLLGGSFASRITTKIREEKGYTYSPYSKISSRYKTAFWAEVASVGINVTGPALKEIFYEINRLRSEPPSNEELKGIANYISGTFVLQNSTRGGIINQLAFLDLHGLPDSYLTNYVNKIHSVTPEQIKEVVMKYIKPDEMTVVITGDKKVIESQLKGFGPIKK